MRDSMDSSYIYLPYYYGTHGDRNLRGIGRNKISLSSSISNTSQNYCCQKVAAADAVMLQQLFGNSTVTRQ